MNNGHSNGFQNNSGHLIVASLSGVLQYDKKSSESGSGKMGKLCICQLGISFLVSGAVDSEVCFHQTSEASFYTSLPNLKKCSLLVDGKASDFADMTDLDGLQIEKLVLSCKDFREVEFTFRKGDETVTSFLRRFWESVYRKIESPSFDEIGQSSHTNIPNFLDKASWECELERLKINVRKPRWKVVENKDFKLCSIISRFFVVPNSISPESASSTGKAHPFSRFMTWCWTDNETMVPLLRCSEPQTILDQSYMNKILHTLSNSKAKTHAVMSSAHLKDSCPDEVSISNSFDKLWNACLIKDSEYFYKNLESSKWLQHIQSLVRASRHIARTLKCDKTPVVVLDATGRDMSCLVVSLVLIICDRHFRTINGLASLINKEWISAGYCFCSSFMSLKGTNSHFYPTFIMFLDCVHNIIFQYPTEFEYTDLYLVEILDNVLSGESELFKFNCPKDISLFCKDKESEMVNLFWLKVHKDRFKYSNPLFDLQVNMLKSSSESPSFNEKTHTSRTKSYSYAVTQGVSDINSDQKPTKRERSGTFMSKIRKPGHLFPKSRKKSKQKVKKEKPNKVGSSSFFGSESDTPRERLTSIKNIFKSKFDPINVNYSMISTQLWERYYFRHSNNSEILTETEDRVWSFVQNISSCSDFISYHCSDDSYDIGEEAASSEIEKVVMSEPDQSDSIQRSDSITTINSDRMERSIHVSEIDLCNDHVDKDNESAEELFLDDGTIETPPMTEGEKRLSHVMEEPEMSKTKSPQTVVLEIAEAANDVQDY